MLNHEMKWYILDIMAIVLVFVIAMFIGKVCMDEHGGTWLAFNLPALSFVTIEICIWRCLRKVFFNRDHKGGGDEKKRNL